MKNCRLALLMMFLLCNSVLVAGNKDIHHVALWGGAGYSGLVNNSENAKYIGGGGGLIGVGYEYHWQRLMLNVGPEFRIFSSRDKVTFPYPYDVNLIADGASQVKHYKFGEDFSENHVVGQIALPILLGAQFDYVYFLAGVKLGYTVFGTYSQSGTLSTSLTDEYAYDPDWKNMPNNGLFTDQEYAAKGSNKYGFDAILSAEVGVNLNPFFSSAWNKANEKADRPWRMRVAVFLDYGIKNLSVSQNAPMAQPDEKEMTTISLHRSDWATSRLNSLLVGVKFTALLQMNKPKKERPALPKAFFYTYDQQTQTGLAASQVLINYDDPKRRPTRRTTNAKGWTSQGLPVGHYTIDATHDGYYETKGLDLYQTEEGDTLLIALKPYPPFTYTVVDDSTSNLLASKISFTPVGGGDVILAATDTVTTANTIALPFGKVFAVRVEATNHFAVVDTIKNLSDTKTYRLRPFEKKKPIILHNLFFATNETKILPQSEAGLQDLFTLLNENPKIRIRITGHTDNVGNDRDNQILSEGRAQSIRQEMIDRGISPTRIEAEGKGETMPIDTNDTEEGRQNNRRVEFVVL